MVLSSDSEIFTIVLKATGHCYQAENPYVHFFMSSNFYDFL